MKQTFFAVVQMPTEQADLPGTEINNYNTYESYPEAVKALIAAVPEAEPTFSIPKTAWGQPLRIEHGDNAAELWLITRGAQN